MLWGGYVRAVKCDCLVLSLGRRSTIYCLDSSPQFCRICLLIQRLHKLSPPLSFCSFVVLVISSFISGRAGEVGSLDLRSSRALIFSNISVETGSLLIQCRPEGMWCDAALRIMARKIFLLSVSQSEVVFCSACLQSFYCIGPSLLFQVDAGTMLYRGDCDVHLQTNEDW